MQRYNFTILFVDALDPNFSLVYETTVESATYDFARQKALVEGQNIVKCCEGTRCLFMRLQKTKKNA